MVKKFYRISKANPFASTLKGNASEQMVGSAHGLGF